MIRFLADENFNARIISGLRRRNANIEIVTVQEISLSGADDPVVLAWAAEHGYVLLTHDVNTMIGYVKDRLVAGLPMLGMIAVADDAGIGRIVEDLMLIWEASDESEWIRQIVRLPW